MTDTSIEILDMVYFEYDKAIIKKESYPILDAVAPRKRERQRLVLGVEHRRPRDTRTMRRAHHGQHREEDGAAWNRRWPRRPDGALQRAARGQNTNPAPTFTSSGVGCLLPESKSRYSSFKTTCGCGLYDAPTV